MGSTIRTALETEWYNGNLDEKAYNRLLRVLDSEPIQTTWEAAPRAATPEVTELRAAVEEAQMEYADCWHEGDRLREHIATIGQELREWQDYADQPKAREVGVKGTRWADGYRQGWIAARTMLRTKSAILALLSAGDKAEAPLDV